ncbi:regulating synaptic membrane exocytosis protein 2-like [Osmerus mordax]|uniref:regulating synaptic membrane exocytosis protein 2-like n=1 Tax=Osmerus mordax TaxID=8014 RepID=UPI00350F09CC
MSLASFMMFSPQGWRHYTEALVSVIDRRRSPSGSRDPSHAYNQRDYAPDDSGMPVSPDYQRDPRHSPRVSHGYREAGGGGGGGRARAGYRDGRGRWRSQEPLDQEVDEAEAQRRRQEAYQSRYRSDPNLARCPVKPQPYEEQMRMHAQVGRARHERRHSDVSLAYTELDHLQGHGPSGRQPQSLLAGQRSYSVDRTNHSPPSPRRSPVLGEGRSTQNPQGQQHLDPSSALHRTTDGMGRNDSLSTDQSGLRPHPQRGKRMGRLHVIGSFSSSEEELATTPEYTSCEDAEMESESLSERVESAQGSERLGEQALLLDSSDSLADRLRRMVGLGGRSFDEDPEWCEPQVKDSGVDTCSSTTLNEELSHSDKHPVSWQPSKDGERLIGRILLNKRMKDGTIPQDTGALLGLKVVGGKMTESGRLCAFITKVKRGSLADTVGHLRPGDQVLEWNGRVLQGATFKEVYNIILDSKPEPQVELVVSRPIGDVSRIPDSSHGQLESSSSSFESQKMGPSISVTSPMSPGMLREAPQFLSGQVSSPCLNRRATPLVPRVQVKLWYDKVGHQLIVTILGAKDLLAREDGRPLNPYVKIYFLPDRSDKSKRRTKTVKKSVEPKWNQTFMYTPVHRREFRERMLEITLWDQARVREEESDFLGEILIELETALLDDQAHWYKLLTHDVSSLPLPSSSPYLQRRLLPGESPTRRLQRSQRISDIEFSDFDCEDGIGVISDYRHNGRDFQSSTLSVPEQVMASNHMARTRSRSPSVPPPQSRRGSLYPMFRKDAVRLLRNTKLSRASSEGGYGSLDRYSRGMDRRGFYHRSRSADQRAMVDHPVYTRSRSTERADSAYMRSMPSLPSGRSAPPSPALTRSNPRSGSVQTSPCSTPVCGRRGRQLPIVPPKGPLDRTEETSPQNGEEGAMKDPSKVKAPDNLSFKSSDSDVSDVSAMSSASRLSSTSHMSVQSERTKGTRKISHEEVQEGCEAGEGGTSFDLADALAAGAEGGGGAEGAGGAEGGGGGEGGEEGGGAGGEEEAAEKEAKPAAPGPETN